MLRHLRLGTRTWVLAAMLAVALYGAAEAGLTGQYLFEEGTGMTAVDTSGNSRDGSFQGTTGLPSFGPGLYAGSNYSLRMNSDGTTALQANAQKVQLPNGTNFLTNAPGATLMAWVKLEGNGGSGNRTIISVSNADAGANSGQGSSRATIQINGGNGQFRALGRKDDSGGSSSAQSGASLLPVAGQTYFVAGVFNYSGGYVRLYVDGAPVGNTAVAAWTTNSANTANLTSALGTVSASNATQEYWPGLIDGARIYDNAFTDEQILAVYRAELVPEPASLSLIAVSIWGLLAWRRRNT